MRHWYSKNLISLLLLPLSWLFCATAWLRRAAYRRGVLRVYHSTVPVIVVGNISVGGSGKTPLVIWLADALKRRGYRPGIVSRGYGGAAREFPRRVHPDDDPFEVGDEPVLLAQRGGCPVMIDPRRARAAQALEHECDVLIADDGLQHYALGRTLEIAVIDVAHGFGNGYCLPSGPLRETVSRLREVDAVVQHGARTLPDVPVTGVMRLAAQGARNMRDGTTVALEEFIRTPVHAVAGIGHPARFFTQLRAAGLTVIEHAFPDHYRYSADDLAFGDEYPIIMTEKDAVKCKDFTEPHVWCVPVTAHFDEGFEQRIISLLECKTHGQKTA